MSDMRVRVEVEVFDNMGESVTLVGASLRGNPWDNKLWWGKEFKKLADRATGDIYKQLIAKHGSL